MREGAAGRAVSIELFLDQFNHTFNHGHGGLRVACSAPPFLSASKTEPDPPARPQRYGRRTDPEERQHGEDERL